ncbi:MAG TPA: hypothetical protein VKQ36_10940, partial [Ktedonobacterales bacterium]|nr:hypothetical protein [Ktedonobacterales bacterium]
TLRDQVLQVDSQPILDSGFESSVPGLFFAGAISNYNFGPLCRFVAGARVSARHITRRLAQRAPQGALEEARDHALVRG